ISGLFINTLLMRVALAPERPLLAWLQELQDAQAELSQHEHTPLVDVQAQSDFPRGRPLFESIVVFENYPAGVLAEKRVSDLAVRDLRFVVRNHYQLTLRAVPGPTLSLQILYNRVRVG